MIKEEDEEEGEKEEDEEVERRGTWTGLGPQLLSVKLEIEAAPVC